MAGLLLALGGCGAGRPPEAFLNDSAYRPSVLRSQVLEELRSPNRAAEPCGDFYEYACGSINRAMTIPEGFALWSKLERGSERRLAQEWVLLTSSSGAENPALADARRYYQACLVESSLQPILSEIASVVDASSLARVTAFLQRLEIPVLFTLDVVRASSGEGIPLLAPGGLGLGGHAPYFDSSFEGVKQQYFEFAGRVLKILGNPEELIAGTRGYVMGFESRLARDALTPSESANQWDAIQQLSLTQLQAISPGFDWKTLFTSLEIDPVPEIAVAVPAYFVNLSDALQAADLATVRNYLRVHLVIGLQRVLGGDALHVLYPANKPPPEWRRCTAATENLFSRAIASALPRPSNGPAQAADVVRYVRDAWKERILRQDLFDLEGRTAALQQIEGIQVVPSWIDEGVFPDQVPLLAGDDLEMLRQQRSARFASRLRALRSPDAMRQIPVRGRWTPLYDAAANRVVLPSEVFDAPFFDPVLPMAVNFSRFGVLVAHEMAHALDYRTAWWRRAINDPAWWSVLSAVESERRSQCLVGWFDSRAIPQPERASAVPPWVVPGIGQQPLPRISGKRTLTENVADVLAIEVAGNAYRRWLADHAAAGDRSAGEESVSESEAKERGQEFFLAYAQLWCTAYRAPWMMALQALDVHAPPPFRINGALTHSEAFAAAFDCPEGSPMNAPTCALW